MGPNVSFDELHSLYDHARELASLLLEWNAQLSLLAHANLANAKSTTLESRT
jgi:Rad3-related DNA helicase